MIRSLRIAWHEWRCSHHNIQYARTFDQKHSRLAHAHWDEGFKLRRKQRRKRRR